jgi:hypothetical protein
MVTGADNVWRRVTGYGLPSPITVLQCRNVPLGKYGGNLESVVRLRHSCVTEIG